MWCPWSHGRMHGHMHGSTHTRMDVWMHGQMDVTVHRTPCGIMWHPRSHGRISHDHLDQSSSWSLSPSTASATASHDMIIINDHDNNHRHDMDHVAPCGIMWCPCSHGQMHAHKDGWMDVRTHGQTDGLSQSLSQSTLVAIVIGDCKQLNLSNYSSLSKSPYRHTLAPVTMVCHRSLT